MSSACVQPPIFVFGLEKGSTAGFRTIRVKNLKSVACTDNAQDEGEAPPKSSPQGAIDLWINEKLQMLYGPVLSEPIPEQLTELIAKHRRDQEDC